MTRFARLCAIAAAALAVTSPAAAQETFKVAYIDPLSGPFANVGELMLGHIQFAVDDINAKGGVLKGTKMELLKFDGKLAAAESLSVLQLAIDQGAKVVFTGGSGSSVVGALAKAYQAKTGKDFLAPRIEMAPRFVAAAMTKAQSTDAKKIALAMEDMSYESSFGPVRMRAEDHQLLLPQVVNTIAPVEGKAVKVGWEGTNYGFRTDAVYTGNELAQGSECKMVRP